MKTVWAALSEPIFSAIFKIFTLSVAVYPKLGNLICPYTVAASAWTDAKPRPLYFSTVCDIPPDKSIFAFVQETGSPSALKTQPDRDLDMTCHS